MLSNPSLFDFFPRLLNSCKFRAFREEIVRAKNFLSMEISTLANRTVGRLRFMFFPCLMLLNICSEIK